MVGVDLWHCRDDSCGDGANYPVGQVGGRSLGAREECKGGKEGVRKKTARCSAFGELALPACCENEYNVDEDVCV
jgi:hypothetical protein